MREMKNSGIPWIGEVPSHWRIESIGSCIKEVNNKNTNNDEDNALQFKMGTIISKKDGDSKYNPETLEAYNKVQRGDIIINGLNLSFDFISQRVGLVNEDGVITSAYLAVRPLEFISSEYLTYLFKGYDSCKALHSMGKGLRQTLGYKEFRKYNVLFPSLPEQKAIADFLDKKCAEIDEMIALQEKIIEELKAYKLSVITEAVTKGLNPDVPMKDSGIEWIGDIPEHWNEKRLKDCGYLYGGLSGKAGDDFNVDEERDNYALFIPFTNIFNNLYISPQTLYKVKVEEGECQNEVLKGDVLFLMSSEDYEGLGKTSLLNVDVSPLYLNSFCKGFRITKSDTNPRYLNYLLTSSPLRNLVMCMGNGFIRVNLRAEKLSKCPVLLPPLDEQERIADYLDNKCTEIDNLISIKLSKIDSLKEYKKSIIYEYVTGKKEVTE